VAEFPGAEQYVPAKATLVTLRKAAQRCEGCDLFRNATQAVMGGGPRSARVVMVGEQPGDKEDRAGEPFVGPAGELLRRAMGDAGLDPEQVFLTNAVKHFRFEERGKRRIHKTPSAAEVVACTPWLRAELELVRPEMIVCLGAVAARVVIGKTHRLLQERGKFFPHALAASVTATVHPSSILRAPDPEQREENYAAFVRDLSAVRRKLGKSAAGALPISG